MKIVALKYGESIFGENYIFKGGRKDVLLPKDITDVIITHSHHDHIEAIRYYEKCLTDKKSNTSDVKSTRFQTETGAFDYLI